MQNEKEEPDFSLFPEISTNPGQYWKKLDQENIILYRIDNRGNFEFRGNFQDTPRLEASLSETKKLLMREYEIFIQKLRQDKALTLKIRESRMSNQYLLFRNNQTEHQINRALEKIPVLRLHSSKKGQIRQRKNQNAVREKMIS